MTEPAPTTPPRAAPDRSAQRARTREAILAGARALVARGEPVTVSAAAAEVGVSKATAYRYFSDPGVLGAEAGLAVEVRPFEEIVAGAATPRAQLLAITLYFFDLAVAHEPAFRQFLARSLDAWGKGEGRAPQRRGARRVVMFRRVTDVIDPPLPPDRADRLVRALTAVTGAEAMIALFDIARADPAEARLSVADASEAILDRLLS